MIGVFDSGLGGLSVLIEIKTLAPNADLLYVADLARAPYGNRSLDEVRSMSHEVANWLIEQGAETLVVACNTASAAALDSLRESRQEIPIVGMEPAVKPAAAASETGVIGVFATEATFQGRLFESVVSDHARKAKVVTRACPEWVEMVERGEFSGPDVDATVAAALVPIIDEGADVLVLGCTHFSFLRPTIEKIAGPGVTVVDPALAVAAQTIRVAGAIEGEGRVRMAASGDPSVLARLASDLGIVDSSGEVLPFPE
ncbi:MAG: glutamate racemase [Acidimicrobiia bacterium]